MAQTTTNLGLRKPARSDYVSVVDDINGNMDILDAAVGEVPSGTSVQDEIDTVNGTLEDAIIVEEYSYTLASAVAAGDYVSVTASNLGITAKDGYTLIGIVGYESSSYNLAPYRMMPNTSGNVLSLKNFASSATSSGVVVTVKGLWIRNGLI